MRLSPFFAAAALALALSPLACASADDGAEPANSDEDVSGADEIRARTFTEADDGRTVTVPMGQNVLLNLKSNATTGYKWQVVSTDRTFGYPTEKYVSNGGAVGSGGVQKMTWKLTGPLDMVGEHKIRLEYKRGANGTPADTFELTIKVIGKSCPALVPPGPSFCPRGRIVPKQDADGCTTSYDCVADCRTNGCASSGSCQACWGRMACVPRGAMC